MHSNQELDLRLVKVGIEVDGIIKTYDQGFYIAASGTKYANPNQNECEVTIYNLDKNTQDYILSETSPFNLNKTPKKLYLDAGRVSYGTTRIFSGNIVTAAPTQPPDIGVKLKCLTSNYQKGKIVSTYKPATTKLKDIAKDVADSLGLSFLFEAEDKQVSNYSFSGGALKQVDKLSSAGQVSAYVDDDKLIVKEMNLPLANTLTVVNLDTGMIGIPEITEQGIKVKFFLDGQTVLGGAMRITSKIYPATNGTYVIYKLGFEISSRAEPFYWIAEGKRT